MLILGNFGKLPIGQILSDLDKFCFAELTQGRSSYFPRAMKKIRKSFRVPPYGNEKYDLRAK